MKDRNTFEGTPDPQEKYYPLAQWLQQVLAVPPLQSQMEPTSISDETQNGGAYHPRFYRQLPDFIMALLNNDPQAILHFAPLFFHLIGCSSCHTAYLEFYDAMRAALEESETPRQITSTLYPIPTMATIPPRMVVHLCQSLIREAEVVLRQAHREHTDGDALARSLLQQAIHISTHLNQGQSRQRALRDLVRVATLFEAFSGVQEQPPALHSYSAVQNGAHHGIVVRGAETALHPAEKAAIPIHSAQLEGSITQQENMLELHLHDLDAKLRGHYVTISVPLGSLLEPIRWLGGNPWAIRSIVPVDEHGTLRTPLGQTELRLSNPEERNLLEAMFLKLDLRLAD